jgi:hypothetical protein
MSDRLLSEQELRDTGCLRCPEKDKGCDRICYSLEDELPFLKAQDLKTAAAIIEWLDEPCDKHGCWRKQPRRICRSCWQELKESVKP